MSLTLRSSSDLTHPHQHHIRNPLILLRLWTVGDPGRRVHTPGLPGGVGGYLTGTESHPQNKPNSHSNSHSPDRPFGRSQALQKRSGPPLARSPTLGFTVIKKGNFCPFTFIELVIHPSCLDRLVRHRSNMLS